MAIFESTEKMYEVLGTLFETLMKDETMYQKFLDSKITIKFTINNPDGYIWLTDEGKVICGEADFKPSIDMTLSGDTCHKFWLQQVKLPVALAKGLIKAKGPMPKVLKLLPLLKPAYAAYPDIAKKFNIPIE
jgi:hypothetical protein